MKPIALLLVCSLLPACVIHVHVHEERDPVATSEQVATESRIESRITGTVRDTAGSTVAARVALVGAAGGGSNTTGTGHDGRFGLPEIHSPELVLHASTQDGRSGVTRTRPGAREVELVVQPGATFVVELSGREKARLAVFADGLRIEDFTLKAGMSESIVVPPCELRLRIYDGDTVFEERHFTATAGATQTVQMQPHS